MEQHGISKLDLKRQNRMQILKILKQRGPTSRIDIAAALELTRAAVTIITNDMIEQGIITEVGEYKHLSEKVPRGRKKILLDINHNYRFVVGITVEENILSVGLATLSGAVLDKINSNISIETSHDDIMELIKNSFNEIMSNNCLKDDAILGIGIGVRPAMYSSMKIHITNKISDYSRLLKAFESFTSLPVVVDNSIKGTAMANIDFQKTKDPNRHNIAFLQFGDVLNFVVTNLNDPIISYDNRTDFVDKIIINPFSEEKDCPCGRTGCAKSELTKSAIVKKVKRVYNAETTPYLYNLTEGKIENLDYPIIQQALIKADSGVNEVFRKWNELMAILVNNLIFSTNPQKLVLHDFNMTEKQLDYFKSVLEQVGGKEISKLIDLSIVDNKHIFLAGAAIAIRELFFSRGGYDRLELVAI